MEEFDYIQHVLNRVWMITNQVLWCCDVCGPVHACTGISENVFFVPRLHKKSHPHQWYLRKKLCPYENANPHHQAVPYWKWHNNNNNNNNNAASQGRIICVDRHWSSVTPQCHTRIESEQNRRTCELGVLPVKVQRYPGSFPGAVPFWDVPGKEKEQRETNHKTLIFLSTHKH